MASVAANVRFKPADYERVKRAAEAGGESVAAYCRRAALRLERAEALEARQPAGPAKQE